MPDRRAELDCRRPSVNAEMSGEDALHPLPLLSGCLLRQASRLCLLALAVTALATRVARRAAELVIGPGLVALVRVTWIATLGAVAHALVAVLPRNRTGSVAAEDVATCHGHRSCCPGAACKACALKGDVAASQNGALERRGRECHVLADPPIRVTRVDADNREVGSREGTGAKSPDFESPGTRARESEGSRQRRRGVEAVGTWPEELSVESTREDGAGGEIASDHVVLGDEVVVRAGGVLNLHLAPGRSDRGGEVNAHRSGDVGVGARQRGAGQNRVIGRRS